MNLSRFPLSHLSAIPPSYFHILPIPFVIASEHDYNIVVHFAHLFAGTIGVLLSSDVRLSLVSCVDRALTFHRLPSS